VTDTGAQSARTAAALTAPAAPTDRDEADTGLVLLALQAEAADNRKPGWIKRRVEHLEFLDTRAVRWRVSVDFEVPPQAPAVRVGQTTYRLVPITTLPKGDLVAFDLRDEAGAALGMPTADETNRRVAPAMVVRARTVLGVPRLPGTLERDLMRIVATSPAAHEKAYLPFAAAAAHIDAEFRLEDLHDASQQLSEVRFWQLRRAWQAQKNWNRAQRAASEAVLARQAAGQKIDDVDPDVMKAAFELMAHPPFRSQLEELAQNYLVYVGLTCEAGIRRIIKLASERTVNFWARRSKSKRFFQALGWRYWRLDILLGGRGGSHHLEVAAPPGVDVARITARPTDPRERGPRLRMAGFSPHVHILIPRESPVRYRVTVYIRVSRPGWLLSSLLVGVLIAGVLVIGRVKLPVLFQQGAGAAPGEAGTAATLLLALLGVIASWLIRPGEHPLAARLLRLVRVLIMIDVLAVLIGTGDLLLHRTTHHLPTPLWSGLAWAAGAIAFLLFLSWLFPRHAPWKPE
jgi:hypothetical protein